MTPSRRQRQARRCSLPRARPETGAPARDVHLYKEVVERIRASDTDVVVNPQRAWVETLSLAHPRHRCPCRTRGLTWCQRPSVSSTEVCRPEIATLDCWTMNFAEADYVMTNTPGMLRDMAQRMTDLGIQIEIEAFDTGHLWFAKQLVDEGVIKDPVMVQLCMGIPWGAPDDMNTFMAMVNNVPSNWVHSAFSIGKNQMPFVAAAVLSGGNVRVGLEDNLWLERGRLASNAELVEKASGIITAMGVEIMTPEEVRAELNLVKRDPL